MVKTEDEAKKALTRINGPETFEDVAKDVSLDASTKEQGGDLGTVSQAQLDPAFGTAAFAPPRGRHFGPVQTKNGWHVGLVEDDHPRPPRHPGRGPRPACATRCVGEARLTEWRGYLAARIRAADACYAKGNRPADPKAPPTDLTPQHPR